MTEGLVHVYTGNGKGKTTAALGLCLRAVGQGLRVHFLQFLKGYPRCGEHRLLERFPIFTIAQPTQSSAFRLSPAQACAEAERALILARQALTSGEYDLIVLDEILTAVKIGALPSEAVVALLGERPAAVELVLTGRGATADIVAAADLVTEMVKVMHPYDRGIKARRGIEY
ncbi:MAG: cob(I)yrinic acid a,c-diamide adenosyltransferase [Chloroflexota bacterium]